MHKRTKDTVNSCNGNSALQFHKKIPSNSLNMKNSAEKSHFTFNCTNAKNGNTHLRSRSLSHEDSLQSSIQTPTPHGTYTLLSRIKYMLMYYLCSRIFKVIIITSLCTAFFTFVICFYAIGTLWFPQLFTKNPYQYHTKHGPNEIISRNTDVSKFYVPDLLDVYNRWIQHVPGSFKSYQPSTYWTKSATEDSGRLLNKLLVTEDVEYPTTEILLSSSQKKRAGHVNLNVEVEALASLNLAIEMKLHGKVSKASKLFQHALNLDPLHSDILNAYGEFLEEHQKDVIKAEQMYTKALINSPQHQKAGKNRQRTLPLVEEIDNQNFQRIDHKRNQLYKVADNDAMFRRAKHESYFQHIHHTTAIEGNTLSLMEIRYILESGNAVSGKSILEHNEILGMDHALAYINSTMLNRIGLITKEDIIEIHRRVLGWVDPLSAGVYRQGQVYVGEFKPPSATMIESEMADLIEWMNSDEALSLHPIELAALAHYRLVYIHPFIDGNGRTSRLLMNVILMQAGFPPVIIRLQDRLTYYETLKEANDGDIRPFIRLVARCTERTLNWFLHATNQLLNDTRDSRDVEVVGSSRDRVILLEQDDDDDDEITDDVLKDNHHRTKDVRVRDGELSHYTELGAPVPACQKKSDEVKLTSDKEEVVEAEPNTER